MTNPNVMQQLGAPVPFSQRMTDALSAAPGLAQAPSVVTDISQNAPDVTAAAQATDLAAQKNALNQAAQAQKSSGWLGDLMSGLHVMHTALNAIPGEKALEKDVISPVAQTMGAPLREVQHEYRMLHDIYDRHGVVAGLGATLSTVVGAGVGAFVGGPEGAVIGAEGGTELDRLVPMFRDSYNRTSSGSTYLDSAGNPVSFGRDIASLIFHDRTSNSFKALSGGLDAAADWFADPLMVGGKAFKGYQAGQRNTAMSLSRAEEILADAHTGIGPKTGVGNALQQLASMNSAADIIARYPKLAPLAPDLAKASDTVEVGHVFLDQLRAGNMADKWNGVFPSRTALFGTVGDWKEAIRQSGQSTLGVTSPEELATLSTSDVAQQTESSVLAKLYQIVTNKQPTAVDEATGKLSNTTFDPLDPNANIGVLRAARRVYGERAGRSFTDLWVSAQQENNLGALKTLWENLNTHAFIRDGVTDDGLLRLIQQKTKMLTHGPGEDLTGSYGFGVKGEDLSTVELGGDRSTQIGFLEGHTGKFVFPNFNAMHDATAALKNAQIDMPAGKLGNIAHVADHLANHPLINTYVDKVFKPLAIGTSASGMRVGLSEVLTYGLKNGFGTYLQALGAAMKGKEDAFQEAVSGKIPTKTVTDSLPNGDTLTHSVTDNAALAKQHLSRAWHGAGAQAVVARLAPVLTRNAPELAETAKRLAQDGGIDNVTGHGASALHVNYGDMSSAADDALAGLKNILPKGKRIGPNMDVFNAAEADQPFAHRAALNEYLDPTGQAALSGAQRGLGLLGKSFGDALSEADRHVVLKQSADEVEKYLRSEEAQPFVRKMLRHQVPTSSALPADPIRQWADTVARGFEGVTAYVDKDSNLVTHNPIFTTPLADGRLPSISDLHNNPSTMRPALVKGRELLSGAPVGAGLNRLVNGTFEKFFAPWVRNLSRNPLYVAAVHEAYGRLKSVADGAIDDDQLWATAKNQATRDIMPMLHNPMEKTQLEYATKNVFPFMFAQRQQYQRYAQALVHNPAGFRKAQLAQQGLRSAGFIQKDANGKDIFVYPAAGHVNAAIASGLSVFGLTPSALIPTGLTGQVQSLNPGAGNLYPGLSPVMAIPLEELGKAFPNELGSVTGKITASSANTPLWEQVLPFSPLRNAARAYQGEHDTQFANSLMSVMAAAKSHDDLLIENALKNPNSPLSVARKTNPNADPGQYVKGMVMPSETASPLQVQQAMDHLRNWTRVHYAFMAAFGFFAPAAPTTTYGDKTLQDTLRTLAAGGTNKQGQTALDRINAYVAAHPEATPYTVYKTKGVGGFTFPPSQAAVDWVQNNQGFLTEHTLAAAALMPQLNDHNPDAMALFQQQVSTGLRAYKTPETFLTDLYVKEAATPYFQAKRTHDAAAAAAANDPVAKKAEAQQWKQWEGRFFAQHPVFQQWVTSPDREMQRQLIVRDLQSVFYGPQGDIAPDSPMKSGVKMLLDAYTTHEAAQVALAGQGSEQVKKAENDQWNGWLDAQAKANPLLAPLIGHVFMFIKPDTVVDMPLLQRLGLVGANP